MRKKNMIDKFDGQYAFLSNFYPVDIYYIIKFKSNLGGKSTNGT